MSDSREAPLGARQGVINAVGALVLFGLLLAGAAALASVRPSAGTLESSAQIGATLLVAYALEVSWMVQTVASRKEPRREREFRVAANTAVGASAGIGVLLALVLAERVQAHDWGWLDYLGLGWAVASLVILGTVVVMQPWLTHEWMDTEDVKEKAGAD